jgi:cation:H+ antiporter
VRERVAGIAATRSELWRGLSRLALGLLALGFGSQYLVDAGLSLSGLTGVGERVFGLGAIALVLALPKLAAASVANRRGLGDMALAATLGSSVADAWALIGVLAWVRPTAVTAAVARGGFPALTAMALVLALALWRRGEVGRVSGGILSAGYVVLLGWSVWGPR